MCYCLWCRFCSDDDGSHWSSSETTGDTDTHLYIHVGREWLVERWSKECCCELLYCYRLLGPEVLVSDLFISVSLLQMEVTLTIKAFSIVCLSVLKSLSCNCRSASGHFLMYVRTEKTLQYCPKWTSTLIPATKSTVLLWYSKLV